MDDSSQDFDLTPQFHDTNQEKKNKVAVLGAGITALLVLGVLVGVNIVNQNQENRPAAAGVEVSKDEQGFMIKSEAPWAQADDEILPEPQLLTIDEYHELYKQVREVFQDRDYTRFKKLASTQRAWHADHPIEFVPPPEGVMSAGKHKNIPGPQNFFLNVIQGIQFQALPVEVIRPVSVERRPNAAVPYNFLEINEESKTKTTVEYTPWKYIVDVKYEPLDTSIDKGSGQVTFVYDKDHWAYHGEFWSVEPHSTPIVTGDSVTPSAEVDMSLKENFQSTINLTEGQSVAWKNVTGMVFSTDFNKKPWNSFYLYNDTYVKQFTEKGEHKYRLFLDRDGKTEIFDGVVNVQ